MAKKVTITFKNPVNEAYIDHMEVWWKLNLGGTYAQLGSDIPFVAGTADYSVEDTSGNVVDDAVLYYEARAYNDNGGEIVTVDYNLVEDNITISPAGLTPDPDNRFSNQFMDDSNSDGEADDVTLDAAQTGSIVAHSIGNAQKIESSATYDYTQFTLPSIQNNEEADITFNYKTSGGGDKKVYITGGGATTTLTESATEASFTGIIENLSGTFQSHFRIQMTASDGGVEVSNLVVKNYRTI